jgi:LPS export ABC transporter protein LptC
MKWLVLFFGLFYLFACSNDLDDIRKVTASDNFPDETATKLQMVSTDSGLVKITLKATLMETIHLPSPITYLKDGLEITFFNEEGEIEAILTSYYGERNESTEEMVVRDSVVLKNIAAKQQLETEELYWKKDSVYSDKAVVVRTPDAILFGKGIVANQTFTVFSIKNPTGKKEIKN